MSNPFEIAEFYRILEIKPGATLEEVKQAHAKQVKAWDPSQFSGDEPRRRRAEKKLRQVHRAFEKLSEELQGNEAPLEAAAETATETVPAAEAPSLASAPQRHWSKKWWFLWILALVLSLGFLGYDSYTRLLTITRTTDISMTNFPLIERDPKSSSGYPNNQHRLVLPALGTDGQHWTMQTERMLDGREGLRVRHVDYDGVAPIEQTSDGQVHVGNSQAEQLAANTQGNSGSTRSIPEDAVTGRDIHWSSSLHWLAGGLAWVEHLFTHEPIAYSLENTVQWANTFALFLVMLILPFCIVRRFGSIATALLALTFVAVYPYYEFSFVGYFDHHGLAATADLMIVLFLAGAGAGWRRNEEVDSATLSPVEKALWQWMPTRRQAKRWMIASGIAVGAGLWVSTASVIPGLAGVGVAALISTGFFARTTERCASPVLKKIAPWIIGGGTVLGYLAAWKVYGHTPAALGAVAGAIAAAGMINGSLLPWLASLAIALLAYFYDGKGNAWPVGHWMGVWGGIVGAGVGGIIVLGLTKNSEEKLSLGKPDPTLWRVWGIASGCASLFFYLLEYAPSHFTMRLEVNHPLYALALFGAGDVMCRVCWQIGGREQTQTTFWRRQWPWMLGDLAIFFGTLGVIVLGQQKLVTVMPLCVGLVVWLLAVGGYWTLRLFNLLKVDGPLDADESFWRRNWLLALFSLTVIAILPVTVLLFGENVFVIRMGGFLLNLHQDYILEFRSFVRQISTLSPMQIVGGISMIPLAAMPIGLLLFATELQRAWKAVLLVVVLPALVMLGLATVQIRWLGISCAMWCAGLAVAAMVTTSPGSAFQWRQGYRRALAALLVLIVLVPFPSTTAISWIINKDSIGELDLQQVVTRDLSQRLRMRLGNETGIVLSGPTTTTWMMYFGGFHGIGSLYWENVDGLKAAGEIYSAGPDWDKAKQLIDKYHITHIAIFSWDPFAMEYARLGAGLRLPKTAQEDYAQYDQLQNSFIVKLWIRHFPPPPWLRFIPYQVPNSPLLKGNSVMLLEVVPPQSPVDVNLRWAQYLMTKTDPNDLKGAALLLDGVLKYAPDYLPALVSQAMLDQTLADMATRAGDAQTARDEQLAYTRDTQAVLANLDKANAPDFAFEDRANLSLLLFYTNHPDECFAQMQKCIDTGTETDFRHMEMERLRVLLQIQAHAPATLKMSPKNLDLALSLLPKPLQGEVLNERALVALPTDQAKAIAIYREAVKLAPEYEPALSGLAKALVLATDKSLHNGEEAIDLTNRASKLSHMQPAESIEILACASAELGKFDDAVFYGRMALLLLENSNNKAFVDQWGEQVKRFENHQTFQAPSP